MAIMSRAHELAAVDLNLLVVLDELLRTGSTTRAARSLGRTQSAVSHSLARLRDVLGDPLLVRAGASLRPTTFAEGLAAPLADVLHGAEAILSRSRVAFDPARLERTFVMSCTDLAELTILPRLLPRLRRDAPGVDVVTRFLGDDVERAVQGREVDLGLGTRLRPLAGVVVETMVEEAMTVLLRRGHPALAQRLTAKRYAALDHALVTPRGLPGSAVDTALEPLGLARRVVLRLPHFAAAALVVAQTDLVVTVPASLARHLDRRLGLVALAPPFALGSVTFSAAYSASFRDDPGHRWLREAVLAAARA